MVIRAGHTELLRSAGPKLIASTASKAKSARLHTSGIYNRSALVEKAGKMASKAKRRITLEMETQTRSERQFQKTESDLSSSTAASASKLGTVDKFRNVLSYLGKKNPFPHSVTKDDTVWLLDNTAYHNETTGKWEAEYVAAVFSQHSSCVIADAVNAVAREVGLGETDPDYPTIEERIKLFTQDIKPGTTVKALHRGSVPLKLGPGGRNGISTDVVALPANKDSKQLVPTSAKVPKGTDGVLKMQTFYADPEGSQ